MWCVRGTYEENEEGFVEERLEERLEGFVEGRLEENEEKQEGRWEER